MDLSLERPQHGRTWVVVTLCLLGMGGALEALRRDLASSRFTSDERVVGHVEMLRGTAKRRARGSFFWERLADDAKVRRRDAIRTGADASARVRLDDGRAIELSENSLVVLNDAVNLDVEFLQGRFVVRAPDGKAAEEVYASGSDVRRVPIHADLVAPADGETRLTVTGEETITFQWTDAGHEARALVLVPARGAKRTLAVDAGVEQTSVALPPGNYRWWLQGAAAAVSQTRSLRVSRVTFPELASPAENAKVPVLLDDLRARFAWLVGRSDAGSPGSVAVEVFKEGADKPFATATVPGDAGERWLSNLALGDLRWRLKWSVDGGEWISGARRFSLSPVDSVEVATMPAEDGILETGRPTTFRWSLRPPVAATTRWEIVDDRNEVVDSRTGDESSFAEWTATRTGEFRWRVQAVTANGRELATSSWRKLRAVSGNAIRLESPPSGKRFEFWQDPPLVEMRWNDPGAGEGTRYRVRASPDTNFRVLATQTEGKDGRATFAPQSLVAGRTYYWRVEALDGSGGLARTSDVGKFYFGLPARLPAPAIDEELRKAPILYRVLEMDVAPMLRWKSVDDAVGYRLTIARAGRPTFQRQLDRETRELATPALQPGLYQWFVEAVDPAGRSGAPSQSGEVKIELGRRLGAPEVSAEEED